MWAESEHNKTYDHYITVFSSVQEFPHLAIFKHKTFLHKT